MKNECDSRFAKYDSYFMNEAQHVINIYPWGLNHVG